MNLIEVEAVEDRSRAEGGHAVILLRGVERASSDIAFNLTPVMAEGGDETEAVGAGLTDLRALAVTMTADGMAMSVGPEIAESALFVPGATVEITLPALGVRGEFLWPAITPLARPKRRNIMIRRNAAEPLLRPVTAAVTAPAVAEPEALASPSVIQPPTPAPASPAKTSETGPAVAPETAPALQPQPAARRTVVLSSAVPRRPVAETMVKSEPHEVPGVVTARQPLAPHTGAPVPPRVTTATEAPAGTNHTGQPRHAPAQSHLPAPPSLPNVPLPGPTGRTVSTSSAIALAVGTLVVGQLIAFRAFNLTVVPRQASVSPPVPPASLVATPPRKVEPPAPPSPVQRSIYEVITAGPRSPRGVAAAGVTPARALQLAHTLLHGSQHERDVEEGAYWLKHYLAGASGGDTVRITLTQLGSAFAQPVRGERDFASARIVWELSSGLGDPVAMCFLGAMHEHGLGVPKSGRNATTWYERAAGAGRTCAAVQPSAATRTR